MRLLHFTIIKLTLCLIVGIILANFLTISLNTIIYSCVSFIFLMLFFLIASKKRQQKSVWFGIVTYVIMIGIGVLVVNLHDQRQFNDHYSRIISDEKDSTHLITFKIREVLKPTFYHDKYVVDLIKMDSESVSGKLLLNVDKDTIQNALHVDDTFITKTSLSNINLPLNPYQFDYSKYLKKQYIEHQISLDQSSFLKLNAQSVSIFGYAAKIRAKIDGKLKAYDFEPDELAIIDALLLGQRKDISQDTYNNYVNAGAIHILAVSGLHVGIILLILNFIFKPLERLKHGKIIKRVLLVMILWSFAVIAGLSPSVTRAVTMFMVIAIGMNLNRPANIYNTLAISMFFILLFKPLYLYDVGFQMSYVAVIAIASIKPIIAGLWHPKVKLVNYFWQLICVTTAAQIGVVPISLFYFHQFPGLFFLSNLVILPFLGFILGLGILVIIMALLNILPSFMAYIFRFCIRSMNDFISWVSHQERFVFTDISFGPTFVVVCYLFIISLFVFFKKPNYNRFVYVLISIIFIQAASFIENQRHQSHEFIVFHKSKASLIGTKKDQTLKLSTNWDSLTERKDNVIKNYKVGNAIANIENSDVESVYQFDNQKLLVIDSLGVYQVKTFKPTHILLRNSPKLNLNRLIDSLQPKLIIADGSNYKSYIQRWKLTCQKQKIPFHHTGEKGAFIYKY